MTENDNRKLLQQLQSAESSSDSGSLRTRIRKFHLLPGVAVGSPAPAPAPASLCASLWERAGPEDQGVWSDREKPGCPGGGEHRALSETLPAPLSPCGLPDMEAGPSGAARALPCPVTSSLASNGRERATTLKQKWG